MLFALFLYVKFTCIMYCACVVSFFVVVQFKYNVKRLELFKIRRYIKCPLLLLLLLFIIIIINYYYYYHDKILDTN